MTKQHAQKPNRMTLICSIIFHKGSSVLKQIKSGVTALAPAGAVLGILTMTEDEKIEVAIGVYDKEIFLLIIWALVCYIFH